MFRYAFGRVWLPYYRYSYIGSTSYIVCHFTWYLYFKYPQTMQKIWVFREQFPLRKQGPNMLHTSVWTVTHGPGPALLPTYLFYLFLLQLMRINKMLCFDCVKIWMPGCEMLAYFPRSVQISSLFFNRKMFKCLMLRFR